MSQPILAWAFLVVLGLLLAGCAAPPGGVVGVTPAGAAAEKLTVLPPGPEGAGPRKMLGNYLRARAQEQFDARRQAVAALKTPDDVQRRAAELRARFVAALGGWPEKTPLNPRTVGTISATGYHIERVIYESRSGHHITALFYLPEGAGPFPGVLLPCGHSDNGKAYETYQRVAIGLVRQGFAVLNYDPIGQGERRQMLDPAGKPIIASSTTEHSVIGAAALLVGQCTATYRVWDGIRSLDYLASRPEVDPQRLGCTGSSGGGTMTSYLMALDERIVAAAPSCYITSLEKLFATIGPQDGEQNIPGQVAFGMEQADYVTLHAPRPVLLCTASRDFFDILGTWTSFREIKHIYGLLGKSERADIVEFDTTHGYPKPQREAMVQWMRRWLQGKDGPAPAEDDGPVRTDAELQCTRSGQVVADLGGRAVPDFIAQRERELARQREQAAATRSADSLRAEVRRLLALPAEIAPARCAAAGHFRREGAPYCIHTMTFETEHAIQVPALLFEPDRVAGSSGASAAPMILYVHDQGQAADAGAEGPITALAQAGRRVLALDLRGWGETSPAEPRPAPRAAPTAATASSTPPATQPKRSPPPDYLGADYAEAQLGLHLGRPLLGQRVFDLLAVVTALAPEHPEGFEIRSHGAAGLVALHAAALDGRIRQLTIEHALVSWSAVAGSPVSCNQLSSAVPGVLAVYDLPDLADLIAPRPLAIRAAAGAMGESLPLSVVEAAYAPGRATYQKAGAPGSLVLQVAP